MIRNYCPLLLPLLHLLPSVVIGLDNGLGYLPQMGYNTWYDFQCNIDELSLKETIDKIIELKLNELGYDYFNLDDCWAVNRTKDGVLIADPKGFTEGSLKTLADYAHSKKLKFGTYTDRGPKTCAGRPGAQGFEALDAQTYADWGVDYLKEDSCFASTDHTTAFTEYGKMRDALNATGRPIFFSVCGWNNWYAPVGASLGNSWRIGPDDTNWNGVLTNIDINAGLAQYAGHGGFNDPCLLLAEDSNGQQTMTERQTRFQFSMWALMTSPLLISGNVRNMSKTNLETYMNKDVIKINQDVLVKQGVRVVGGDMQFQDDTSTNVWAKPLSNGDVAIGFANASPKTQDIICDSSCLNVAFSTSFKTNKSLTLMEKQICGFSIWENNKKVIINVANGYTAKSVQGNGGMVLLRVGVC